MTHIAHFPTKKAFKEAVDTGENPYLEDPSIFSPVSGRVSNILTWMNEAGKTPVIYVTNHPKRSWFAEVKLVKGKVRVS